MVFTGRRRDRRCDATSSAGKVTAGSGLRATRGKKLESSTSTRKTLSARKTNQASISTPIIIDNIVYIANGQGSGHGEGVGHLYAIDPTKAVHHKVRRDLALRQDPAFDIHGGLQRRQSSTMRTLAVSFMPWMRKRASRTGRTICSRQSGRPRL